MHSRFLTAIAVAAALFVLSAAARAALIWDNNGATAPNPQDGDGTWDNLNNYNWWNTSTNVQWDNASPTVAQLGNAFSTTNHTITVDAGGVTATGLVFKKSYTLQTGPVTLSGTAPVVSFPTGATSGTTAIVNSNLTVTDGNAETADDLILQGANGGTPGTNYWKVVLSGTSTYTGRLIIKGGINCNPTTTTALSSVSTGTVVETNSSLKIIAPQGTFGTGQTLELSGYGFGKTAVDSARAALILAPQVNDGTPGATGDTIWAGNVVLNAESTIASTQSGIYKNIISGVISGGFNLIKNGDQPLYLTNSNTYTGNTEIRRGGLTLDSALGQAINKNGGNLVFRSDLGSNAAIVNVLQNEQIGDGAEIRFNYTGSTAGYQTINLLGNTETVKGLSKSTASATSAYIQNEKAETLGKLVLDTAGGDFSFNGVIRDGSAAGKGALALEKKGLGTQTLAGANTYSGSTLITAGGLSVTGSIVSDVTVQGGSLLGTGTVTGNVVAQTAGHVAPGTSIGTLTVTGNATLGGTLDVEYNSTTDAIDMLSVSGQLDLSGGTLSFSDIGPLPQLPLDQEAYIFAQYGSLVGSLPSVANLPAGYVVDFSYGESNNQIALVVPEPAMLVLLAGLALAMAGARIRQ